MLEVHVDELHALGAIDLGGLRVPVAAEVARDGVAKRRVRRVEGLVQELFHVLFYSRITLHASGQCRAALLREQHSR